MTLLDFQIAQADHLLPILRDKRYALIAWDMGLGKTVVSCWLAKHFPVKVWVICPKTLRPGWINTLQAFNIHEFETLSYEKMLRNQDEYLGQIKNDDIVVFDECFPAKTKVLTPAGEKDIADIVRGDFVLTPGGKRMVTKTWKHREKRSLVKVATSHGSVVCTPDHPIYTDSGYKKAGQLTTNDVCYCYATINKAKKVSKNLHPLREDVHDNREKDEILLSELHIKMVCEAAGSKRKASGDLEETTVERTSGTNSKADDRKQPDEQFGNAKSGVEETEKYGAQTESSWRKRTHNRTAKAAVREARGGVGDGVCSLDPLEETGDEKGLADNDNRFSQPRTEACNRSGRPLARMSPSSGQGQAEKGTTGKRGVENNANKKQGRYRKPRWGGSFCVIASVLSVTPVAKKEVVYDIEVEDEHCFFANRILVSNCHRMSNPKSKTGKMAVKLARCRVLLLSATACQSPLNMKAMGFILKLHRGNDFYKWILAHGCAPGKWGGFEFNGDSKWIDKIRSYIFPHKGSCLSIKDVPRFKDSIVIEEPLDFGSNDDIQKIYTDMGMEVDALAERVAEYVDTPLTQQQAARQHVELLKVPGTIELVEDALANGYSVIVFVNYLPTMDAMLLRLPQARVIRGEQKDRQEVVDAFQSNKINLLFVQAGAGAEGLSLGDETGQHPRMAFIFPSFNARQTRQCMGRPARITNVTPATIRFLIANGTIEEKVQQSYNIKTKNMRVFNEGTEDKKSNKQSVCQGEGATDRSGTSNAGREAEVDTGVGLVHAGVRTEVRPAASKDGLRAPNYGKNSVGGAEILL